MQVIDHIEKQDADGNRGRIEKEFILDDLDKEVVDSLRILEGRKEVSVILSDENNNFYDVTVNEDYEVINWC